MNSTTINLDITNILHNMYANFGLQLENNYFLLKLYFLLLLKIHIWGC